MQFFLFFFLPSINFKMILTSDRGVFFSFFFVVSISFPNADHLTLLIPQISPRVFIVHQKMAFFKCFKYQK